MVLGWFGKRFSISGPIDPEYQVERLWKRVYKLDNEIYKIFQENQDLNTDKLAFDLNVDSYKIWKINTEIEKTGKLIDALLDFNEEYLQDKMGEEFISCNRYKINLDAPKRDKLFIEKRRPNFNVQDALRMRDEKIMRDRKNENKKQIYE